MSLKLVISGPRGKMGSKIFRRFKNDKKYSVVGLLDYKSSTQDTVPVYSNAQDCFKDVRADVFIDFTNPKVSEDYILSALENGVKVISGTTGFDDRQLIHFMQKANQNNLGCVICPNFALGAVFMMIFSQYAAKYFNEINIIEKHHEQKFDIPSGTANTLKDLIQASNKNINPQIFSVRSAGFVAHHEVIFGGPGQTLSIKHDSLNRESFLDGLMLTLKEIKDINEYVFGLENVLRL